MNEILITCCCCNQQFARDEVIFSSDGHYYCADCAPEIEETEDE